MCINPVVVSTYAGTPWESFACGQCMPCRINTRRKKTARILLEASNHPTTTFVTLTIDDEHLTYQLAWDACPVWTVVPKDLQKWMKRVRYEMGPHRFVGIGEYGNKTGRPHYHALLFGMNKAAAEWVCKKTWHQGITQCDEMTEGRAAYIAGYTTKKMTKREDERLELFQEPEFFRQSLKPPIGVLGLDRIEQLHYTKHMAEQMAETLDVAGSFNLGNKSWPLDRTMRRHLRKRIGLPESNASRKTGGRTPTAEELKDAKKRAAKAERRYGREEHF